MIAALFVQSDGSYSIPGIDAWPERRDARNYDGPYPVVAHPPCNRWCRMAPLNESLHGYKVGDDGGCFRSALHSVRKFGGILEHPAYSYAWDKFQLPHPKYGCWQQGFCGGWVTQVDQGEYGLKAKKPTWLYAFGVNLLPSLRWENRGNYEAVISHLDYGRPGKSGKKRIDGKAASATPPDFRELLISIAESVNI